MTPIELKIADQRRALVLTWSDGATCRLSAETLRTRSLAASAVRAVVENEALDTSGVTVVDVQPVGSYAVQFFFSDGHDRGIFPFTYLRQLALEAS